MAQTNEEERSIFRQEALDEFTSRFRGDVIKLPVIKLRWVIALGMFWLLCSVALGGVLVWREPVPVRGYLQSKIIDGKSTVSFILPKRLAMKLSSRSPMMVGEQYTAVADAEISEPDFDKSLWVGFVESVRQEKYVCWTADVDVSFVSEAARHQTQNYQLTVVSDNLIDVLLLKLAPAVACNSSNQ